MSWFKLKKLFGNLLKVDYLIKHIKNRCSKKMSLNCPKCGAANEESADFCVSCGDDLTKAREKKVDEKDEPAQTSEKKLYRSRTNKMLTGLAAGLAKYFDMDVDLMICFRYHNSNRLSYHGCSNPTRT